MVVTMIQFNTLCAVCSPQSSCNYKLAKKQGTHIKKPLQIDMTLNLLQCVQNTSSFASLGNYFKMLSSHSIVIIWMEKHSSMTHTKL